MATTRGWALRGKIQDAIDYILNIGKGEDKTQNGLLVSVYGNHTRSPYSAAYEWQSFNLSSQKKNKSDIVGYHFQQSFKPGSITPEKAIEVGEEWARTMTKGKNDFVITTHVDKDHIHNHIIINPIREDGSFWNIWWKKDKERFRAMSDRICKKHGLEILEATQSKSRTYIEWLADNTTSNKNMVKQILDYLIPRVKSYEDLKLALKKLDFDVKDGTENKSEENIFRFTADIKLFRMDIQDEECYWVRIPYQKYYVQIPKEQLKWLKENKTAEITIPIDMKLETFDQHLYPSGLKDVETLKHEWEDKTKKGRQGLRIRPPGAKTYLRAKYLDEDFYTMEEVKKRISENKRSVNDLDVQKILKSNSFEETQDVIRDVYRQAHIRVDIQHASFYTSKKQQNFFAWKAKQVQEVVDKMAFRNLLIQDRANLPLLQARRKSLSAELQEVMKLITQLETQAAEMEKSRIEGTLSMSDQQMTSFYEEKLNPLKEKKELLKNSIAEYSLRINQAQTLQEPMSKEQKKNRTK